MRGCSNNKVNPSQACHQHQQEWKKYVQHHSKSSLAGVKRMLKRPGESHPWQSGNQRNIQPHDEEASEPQPKHYFSPPRFYCVETICAPCGIVIAWTKFDKSESPTNILNFLNSVYPNEQSRPDYVCIDKACLVLRTSVSNALWNSWLKTTRFIVDAYHYINHRTSDYICRKWCNPGPLNGSAPNLVVVDHDKKGKPYYKRAFNTQVNFRCKQ